MCTWGPMSTKWAAYLSCTQWKHYTLSYFKTNYYCHYCYLYNFYKSLFKLSDSDPPPDLVASRGCGARCALSHPRGGATVSPRSRHDCRQGQTVLSVPHLRRVTSNVPGVCSDVGNPPVIPFIGCNMQPGWSFVQDSRFRGFLFVTYSHRMRSDMFLWHVLYICA